MSENFGEDQDDNKKKKSKESWRDKLNFPTLTLVILGIVLGSTLIWGYARNYQPTDTISYSDFRTQVRADNVSQVQLYNDRIEGQFAKPIEQKLDNGETQKVSQFTTNLPSFDDSTLIPLLDAHNVEVEVQSRRAGTLTSILFNLLPLAFLVGLAVLFLRRMPSPGGEVGSLTRSRARKYSGESGKITFQDVAGSTSAKEELQEIIEYLRTPERFRKLGAQIPKGVLLVGPPGTGKTLLARAVAGEAQVPFYSLSGSDFVEVYVGVGASRVRKLFEEAKESSPAIVFIDELDSLGRTRGTSLGGNDEREQTLNQLLSEMDGFETNQHIIIMAATNRPEILDTALLRPGRFDRQITVDRPSAEERLEILKIHARNKPLDEDVDLDQVARGTPGFSGADLANLLNEAALLAARRHKGAVGAMEIGDARDKVLMGLERNLVLDETTARLIAYHEAGHAVVAGVLPNADPVHKVTIVPRGRAMGVTQQLPERDRYLYSRDYLLDFMAVTMGGRAAEEKFLKTMTTGAENDLKQATNLARRMVLDWGMSEKMGHVAYREDGAAPGSEDPFNRQVFSPSTAREIDAEVQALLENAYRKAMQILDDYSQAVEKVVEALLEKEQISGSVVMDYLNLEHPHPAERTTLEEKSEHV
jgi:cell division protease FtsH